MTWLPHRTHSNILAFLKECHATLELEQLRRLLPELLVRLIRADRCSVDEVKMDATRHIVIPCPEPAHWSLRGAVYQAHFRDHPIWREQHARAERRTIQFEDFRRDGRWTHSPLYNEYFRPLDVRHQLSVFIHRSPTNHTGIAFSRSSHRFTPEEQATFELLIPHIEVAWCNALAFDSLRQRLEGLPAAGTLTTRESEILHWVAEGKRNAEIAVILGISPRTVGKHVEHVLEKLGVETRTAAVRCLARSPP